MPSIEKQISIRLKLVDEMSKALDGPANSLKKMGDSLTSIGNKMTVGITAPLVGMGVAMMKTFADFESVIAELGARTGATAEELQKMEKFAIEMGRTTAFSATEAAQALLELTSSGASAADAMEMLPQVLNLAAAGALELGEAADAVTDIMAQFNVELADTQTVVDILTQAAGASSATVEDLIQAFNNAGPVLNQFGLSVEESAAAMAVLAENGIKGAEAGTQLKSMMLNMTRDTEAVSNAWTKLGVSLFDASGNMRDIDDVFKDINKAMEGMSMEEQIRLSQDLAGSYGIVGFNALRASNGISDMQAKMLDAAGAEAVAEARKKTLMGAVEQLGGAFETLSIVLGNMAEGPLVSLINGITHVVNEFSKWAEANPAMAQTLMIILAIIAAIGPLLVIVGQLISAFTAIATVIPIVQGAFAAFMALGAPVIALIGLVIGAIILLAANWNQLATTVGQAATIIDQKMGGIFSKMRDGAGNIAQAVGWAWQQMLSKAGTALSQLGQLIWMGISKLASSLFTMGQNIISGLLNGIKSKAVDLVSYIFGLSKELTAAIKSALGIHSPSKVMMDIGENVVAGFHKGIESMGGIGVNVPQTGGSIQSRQPTLAVAGASGGGGIGGGIVIQNLNLPPGTPREQAMEVIKILGEEAKKKGARSTRR